MMDQVIAVVETLSAAGFLAAKEEALQLVQAANGDAKALSEMIDRRLTGEPLAWITGRTSFCDIEILVLPGVYVPRWQTELLARRAIECLPASGMALDICTGSGAIARILMEHRPQSRVIACDIDPMATACAKANGVDAYQGDLLAPLPAKLEGQIDVITAVVPYVPTSELPLLQRDTFRFETSLAYDGGFDGTNILRRVISASRRFLRLQGTLLLELGGHQAERISADLEHLGYTGVECLYDEEGDLRGIEAKFSGLP